MRDLQLRLPVWDESRSSTRKTRVRTAVASPDATLVGSADPSPSECPKFVPRLAASVCPPCAPPPACTRPPTRACLTFAQCALSHGFNSATVRPSTPGAPSLPTTRSYAHSMLLRSTTASIHRGASGFVRPAAPEPASAPAPDPDRFRLPSSVWAALACASALSTRIEVCCPTPVFHVRPFAVLRPLLWPRLTSGDPSQHLLMSVALKQTARSPRV